MPLVRLQASTLHNLEHVVSPTSPHQPTYTFSYVKVLAVSAWRLSVAKVVTVAPVPLGLVEHLRLY